VGGGAGASIEGAPHPRRLIDLEPELLAAQSAVAAQDWPYVEELCRYTLGRDPTNKWALIHMTEVLTRRGQHREALEHAHATLALYSDNDQALGQLANVHVALGEREKAYRVLRDGLEKKPKSETLVYLTLSAALEAGHAEVCAGEVAQAVSAHPKSAVMVVLEARCAARAGKAEESLAALERASGMGFRRLDLVKQSKEFAAVVALPGFEELLASAGEHGEQSSGGQMATWTLGATDE
jgi:predicted Zn-dependent protease